MARYLMLSILAWLAILFATLRIGFDLPTIHLMWIEGVKPGTPIFLDELAPSHADLTQALLINVGILLAGIGLRIWGPPPLVANPANSQRLKG